MKKIVLCPNPYRDKDLSAAREAAEILRSVGQRTVFCLPFRPEGPVSAPGLELRPLQQELRGAELLIAFGGDGTILHLAKTAASRNIPVLGVNLGSLGFMSELERNEMHLLKNLATGEFKRERRMMLDISVEREGRRVYRNIQKVIQFLVAGNIAEILLLFLAVCLGWQMPVLAVHILLINLATDSLPAVALGVDPADSDVMRQKPVKSGTLFEGGMVFRIVLHGLFISAAALAAYWIGQLVYRDHAEAMTMTFIVLALSQLAHALNQRSNVDSVFRCRQARNPYLAGAIAASLGIVALVVFVPPLMRVFSFVSLRWQEWLICLGLSLFPLLAVEISKLFLRLRRRAGRRKAAD